MPFFQILLLVTVTGVVFVNGWTDAPNAIATAVASGALPYRRAVRLAAACNLLGLICMCLVNTSVATTVASTFSVDTASPRAASAALCAAMLAIILFAVAAWWFGIPTSESHALLAALAGASLALGNAGGLAAGPWLRVLGGLALSLFCGLFLGFSFTRLLGPVLRARPQKRLARFQALGAAAMAFLHGAQDGQKFLAVFVLAGRLAVGRQEAGSISIGRHLPALALVAAAMAIGTATGGKRIIDAVGKRMTTLEPYQGLCADLAGSLCLLFASLTGIPMSTTHTKTTAILGAGAAKNPSAVHKGTVGSIVTAWAVTFPACGLLGFLFTRCLLLLPL